jgi:hypothetical protein
MKTSLIIIHSLGFLIAFGLSADAQKITDKERRVNNYIAQNTIDISDSLAAHADKLDVHMGHLSFGKIKKFSFGHYSVVESKVKNPKVNSNSNFFNTKTETKSTQHFSFELSNGGKMSADVEAAHSMIVKSQKNMVLGVIHVDDTEIVEVDNMTAWISINTDPGDIWTLFMGETGSINPEDKYATFLTNKDRTILLTPVVASKSTFDKVGFPAMGFEFVENGQSIGALQYFSIALGEAANMVWIDTRMDDKMKLILAAAMTSILQFKNQDSMEY